jgi:hypothetical protein
MSGRAAFMGSVGFATLTQTYYGAGINIDRDAPTDPGRYAFVNILGGTLPGPANYGFRLNITNSGPKAISCLVQCSVAMNTSRNFYKGPYYNPYCRVVTIPSAAMGPLDFTFWAIGNVGKRVFWRARAVTANAAGTIAHQLTDFFYGSSLIVQGV